MLERLGGPYVVALVAVLVFGTILVGSIRAAGATPSTTSTSTIDSTIHVTTPSTTPTTTEPPAASTTSTTTSTSTSTSTVPTEVRPFPLQVSASTDIVGIGGDVEFLGSCAAASDVVAVDIDGPVSTSLNTGVSGTSWAYTWTAPTDEAVIGSFQFRFWCGDRSGFTGDYPPALVRRVDMVASAPTGPTHPSPNATGVATELPETK